MKKSIITLLLAFVITFSTGGVLNADNTSGEDTSIPSLTIEQLMLLSKSKQVKVDIIKKNNIEIQTYKDSLSNKIRAAAERINNLKIEVIENTVEMSDEKLDELKELLEIIQNSSKTLNEDATTVSKEIDDLLDLILSKGMKLEQYDQIIEKQNDLIVKMKNILINIEKI
jgi:peptidoglycan hydrolase CwlO-like protein